ncbi:MAG TPA: outer membrane lipoprotein-sorting protein [Vicinamibacterales bacterium]|nr:outer membrane lipoprotein-sorting protein [Vicinamibacterales bacterium]
MTRRFILGCPVCLLFLMHPFEAAAPPRAWLVPAHAAVDPAWVARQVDARDTGRDSRAEIRLRLHDRRGRVRERALVLLARRDPAGDRLLIRFTAPADIAGTGFLVRERKGGEDERLLYLPSLGRVRRIAGAEAQESFVGTDFTYEDIGGRELDDYVYALPDENAVWISPSGARHAAWLLESRSRDASTRYPRVRSLVRKDNFVVVSAEIFDRSGERRKRYGVRRLEPVEGIWTVLEAEMADLAEETRTELVVERIDYNVGLSEAAFSRRELEKGAP